METEILKWLFDAAEGCRNILDFTRSKDAADYGRDLLLRSAVERQFEIVGEALRRTRDRDAALVESIDGWRGAISFRNILAHGYDHVDDALVWGIIESDLPPMLATLERLLGANQA